MGHRFRIATGFTAIFLSCATLSAASAPSMLRKYPGLGEALHQALYAVEGNPGSYTAQNAAQHLQISFTPAETRLVQGSDALTLRLEAYGGDSQLRIPEPGTLVSAGNRMEYRRGTLTEWYVNEARGLEQGFTLSARPGASGPVVIALEFKGSLRPVSNAPGEVGLLDSSGRSILRYGGLKAWDVNGQPLDSRLELRDREVRLIVRDDRAAYPITIDPVVMATTLLASDGVSSDDFGQSVSASGTTAVIGANRKNSLQGAAYVFVQSGKTWSQEAKLTASDGAQGDQFGVSVSVNGDTAIVGAPGQASGQGAAYVFARFDGAWTQQAKLAASDGAAGDQFGISVSVNAVTAVVGAASQASSQGAAYVFVQSGTGWTQQAKLTASGGAAGDHFGVSVAVNGSTALAGAPGKTSHQGAAYVFVQAGSSWAQQGELTASNGAAGDSFGNSVALSGDTAVAGAVAKSSGQGAAYVFARSGTNWSQQAALTASDGAQGDAFGNSVSVDGNTVVVGANARSFNTGAAYVFVNSGTSWGQQAELTASDKTESYQFAFSVAVSGDTIAVGAPIQYNAQGEGYFFSRSGANWTQQSEIAASDAANPDLFGWSVALSGNTAVVGAIFKQHFQGGAYVFVNAGGTWTQQAKLVASDAATLGGDFGNAVAIDGDTAVIGAYLQSSGSGAAYVFVRSGGTWTQQAKLLASDGAANDYFGSSVAVNGDTAAVGAYGHNASQGALYVFVRSGASWTQQASLVPSDAAKNDRLGSSVAIQGDTLVVSAFTKNSNQGAAYVFVRSGTSWTQQGELTPGDNPTNSFFGYAARLDGDTVVIGAPYGGLGAAYVYVRSGTSWTQQSKLTASDLAGFPSFGYAAALEGDVVAVGSPGSDGREGAIYVFGRSGTRWTQVTKLAGATGGTDNEGWSVALNGGTIVAGAIGPIASRGAAYVFPLPIISAGGIVHAASFAHTVAPGSIASAFGINFAAANNSAGTLPLPTILGGVSMTVNNVPAPLIFVGKLQANFQVPFETAPGTATIVVTANGIPGPPATVTVAALQPGIFTVGSNQAVVLNPDTSLADSAHPAKVGNVEVMYVTGLGALDHPIPTGLPASSSPLSNAKVVPSVTVGSTKAVVQFAGMTPGFVGLGQINWVVPKLATGTYPVVVTQGGVTSNNPMVSVAQ